jgi:hypothetical protein
MYNLQNSSKTETIKTISKGCQPLPSLKDKDNDSSTTNISLFESQLKTELISSLEEAKRKKMELHKNLTPEQSKSWSKLHLYELACTKSPDNPRLKK